MRRLLTLFFLAKLKGGRATLILALVAAAACSTGADSLPTSTSPLADPTTSSKESPSPNATEFLGVVQSLAAKFDQWNDNQLDWLVALQDPGVSLDEFVVVQQSVFEAQGALVANMAIEVSQLDSSEQVPFQPLLDHYAGRLDLLKPLMGAASSGTEEEFQTALVTYQQFVPEGLSAMEFLLTSPTAERMIQAEGLSGQQIVDAVRLALGQSD